MRRRKSGRNLRRSGKRNCELNGDFSLKIENNLFFGSELALETLIIV